MNYADKLAMHIMALKLSINHKICMRFKKVTVNVIIIGKCRSHLKKYSVRQKIVQI